MTWQPIETAPKYDGEYVLLFGPEGVDIGTFVSWSIDSEWRRHYTSEYDNDGAAIQQPTHWMPLPEPPKGDKQ